MTVRLLGVCIALLVGLFSRTAFGDQWGCEVLLCLSNPAGPTAVKECEPPIPGNGCFRSMTGRCRVAATNRGVPR